MDPDKKILCEFHRTCSDGKRYHGYGVFINLGMCYDHARIYYKIRYAEFHAKAPRSKGAKEGKKAKNQKCANTKDTD
jgi:hypothetical protein